MWESAEIGRCVIGVSFLAAAGRLNERPQADGNAEPMSRRAGPPRRTDTSRRENRHAQVTAVAGDITTEQGRAATLAACPNPDILINNAGGPPHGDFRDWSIEDWQKAVNANMLTPIMLIKATVDGMCERRFGRIVNITSGSVKSPIPNLGMSNGARGPDRAARILTQCADGQITQFRPPG